MITGVGSEHPPRSPALQGFSGELLKGDTASVMFTIKQIDDLHARLGSARTFPEYVLALKGLGVERYDFHLADGNSEDFGAGRS